VLAICPPLVTVIWGALTVADPALPLAVPLASARIPLPPLSDSGPCEVTVTVAPLP
jgi:hypothetical protein